MIEDDSRATAELASCNGQDERNACFFVDGESLICGIVIHFHTGSDDWVTGVENAMLLGGIFNAVSLAMRALRAGLQFTPWKMAFANGPN